MDTQIAVTYVLDGDERRTVKSPPGVTVMAAAQQHGIDAIIAECGGACACATCHVYVEEAFLPRLPEMCEYESEMLDNAAAERRPNSRLACQIPLTPELSGMVVIVPEQM